jgi:catechol 2,3-dioxygenase-like lactoylglutathione lyase family enzyme
VRKEETVNPPNQPPFTLDHLDHVVLRVQDLQQSTAFYRMLGGQVGEPRGAGTPVRITDGQTIILQGHPDYVPAEKTAIDHINLHVQAEDLQQVIAYLRANGVAGIHETGNAGNTVRVLDPDRNVIEIRVTGKARAGRGA